MQQELQVSKTYIKTHEDIIKKINKNFVLSDKGNYFIIKNSNKILGYALVIYEEEKYWIKEIFIEESNRYKRYGTCLLNFIIDWVIKLDINELYVFKCKDIVYFFLKNNFKIIEDKIVKDNLLDEKNRKKEGVFSTVVSIFLNLFLAFIKIFFGILGNSKALIADGFHSFSDIITSIIVLVSIIIGSKPADEEHPYGHGQLETIAGNIVGVLLIITSLQLIIENIRSFIKTNDFSKPEPITIYVIILSIIIKYGLYLYKIKIGRKQNNDAIIADAKDHKSDVISSVGVLIGILLAIYISPIFDFLAGLVVALIIGKEGVSVVLESSNKIMDEQEEGFLNQVLELVMENKNVMDAHDIVMKTAGDKVHLTFHIMVDKDMTVKNSNHLINKLIWKIRTEFNNVQNVIIHLDPSR